MPNFARQYKDKEKCRQIRNEQRARYYKKTAIYQGREWTAYEDKMVLEHSMPDMELSALLQRGVRAIQIRRCRLKKKGESYERRY